MIRRPWPAIVLGSLLVAGCATVPSDSVGRAGFEANHDPLEPLNRKIFGGNLVLDRTLIKPLAKGYQLLLPSGMRDALRHFLDNLHEPIVFGNCLLQGRLEDAGTVGGRFVVNTTLGAGGIADVATGLRLKKQIGDFGQTLWSWRVPEGPYLVVPVLGPSSPRDGIGMGVDVFMDPFRYVARHNNYPTGLSVSRLAADGVDRRARNIEALDEMEREAVDYYASFRSLYRQNRAAELRGPQARSALPSADFYEDPGR